MTENQELIGSLSTHGSLPSRSSFMPPISLLHLLMFCSLWPCPSLAFLSFCNNGEWAGIRFFLCKDRRNCSWIWLSAVKAALSHSVWYCIRENFQYICVPGHINFLCHCLIDLFKGRYLTLHNFGRWRVNTKLIVYWYRWILKIVFSTAVI